MATKQRRAKPVATEQGTSRPSTPRKRGTANRRTKSRAKARALLAPKTAAPPAPAPAKAKPPGVVRDSFTMPMADFTLIRALKKRCTAIGVSIRKSELLRAGIKALAKLADRKLVAAVGEVERVKTGRPAGERKARAKDARK